MTYGAEAALPTLSTIIKTQLAKLGVEVTVDVIDRLIFLRRLTTDRDGDQSGNWSAAAWAPDTISWVMETRAGIKVVHHADKPMDALLDRMKEAATQEMVSQAGEDVQR
jgi:ABC-type transport system substrate-binding protein